MGLGNGRIVFWLAIHDIWSDFGEGNFLEDTNLILSGQYNPQTNHRQTSADLRHLRIRQGRNF